MTIMRHRVEVTDKTRTFIIVIACTIVVIAKKSYLNDLQFHGILIELDLI